MILFCLNLLLLFTLSFLLFKNFAKGKDKLIFPFAFWAKITGGISFASIFYFQYHKQGDTFYWFENAGKLAEICKTDFRLFLSAIFSSGKIAHLNGLEFLDYGPNVFVKLLSLLHFITGGNYLLCTLYFSLLSFFCSWKLFTALVDFNQQLRLPAMVAFLFIPSVLLWTSGCISYSVTLSVLFLSISFLLQIIRFSNGLVAGIFFFALTFILLFLLDKILFFTSLALSLAIILNAFIEKFNPSFKKYFWLKWTILITVCLLFYWGINGPVLLFSGPANLYKTQLILDKLKEPGAGASSSFTGKSFDIASYETFFSVPKILRAIFTALFPFPKLNGLFALAAWIENILLFLLVPFLIFRTIARFFFKNNAKEKTGSIEITAACFFVLLTALTIGLSAYNYGALIRKRVIFEPFLFFILLIPFFKTLELIKMGKRTIKTKMTQGL